MSGAIELDAALPTVELGATLEPVIVEAGQDEIDIINPTGEPVSIALSAQGPRGPAGPPGPPGEGGDPDIPSLAVIFENQLV